MNKRTIYLLAGAGIIGLFYFGDLGYQAYVEEPIKKLNKKAESIRKSGDKAQSQIDRHPSVLKALESYEKMSLPYTADVTRTAYQDWLLALVKSNGFTGTSIEAGKPLPITIKRRNRKANQPERKVVLNRFPYSLRFRGSLQQFVKLLHEFYSSGHLHKIKSISLNPSSGGSILDISLSVEALSMRRTERESELSNAKVNRLAKDLKEDYLGIARRNIFSRTGDKSLNNIQLTGITYGKLGEPQAWIKLKPEDPAQRFGNDESFEVFAHRIEVIDIQNDLVLLLVDGQPASLEPGKTFDQAVRLNAAGKKD